MTGPAPAATRPVRHRIDTDTDPHNLRASPRHPDPDTAEAARPVAATPSTHPTRAPEEP
ncbi:hypothetical protein ACFC6L_11050 [Kitasatospora phosalacinea]|uniref:hypothetical protein n=1 Tax=Kitasatospora phosalacinea TaxID=2065 RepID=UPI0035E19F60